MTPQIEDCRKFLNGWIDLVENEIKSEEGLINCFEMTIQALNQGVNNFLSLVTIHAVLDRVLYLAQEKYPMFMNVQSEPLGLILTDFRECKLKQSREILIEGLSYFIGEYVSILYRITRGVIMSTLFQELGELLKQLKNKGEMR